MNNLDLLKGYIKKILSENIGNLKQSVANEIIAAAAQNRDKYGSWQLGRSKYGEIRLRPDSVIPKEFDPEQLIGDAGYVASLSPSSKSAFDTWNVQLSDGNKLDVIFAAKLGKEENPLETSKILGYGGEHAVYAAINKLGFEEMIAGIKNDARIKPSLDSSAPSQVDKFFEDCESMKEASQREFAKLQKVLTVPQLPSTGRGEVDIVAVDEDNNVYNIHVKYKSKRLIGIQKKDQKQIYSQKNLKSLWKMLDDPAFEKSSENYQTSVTDASSIYQTVRDELLFKEDIKGGKKTLDDQGNLKEEYLTEFGKNVRQLQIQNNTSEIAAILSDQEMRDTLFAALSSKNFENTLARSLKEQLGLASSDNQQQKSTTIFVNFESNDTAKLQVLSPDLQNNFEFQVIPGNSTFKSYIVDVKSSSDDKFFKDVFYIELGSIKRGKFVQVHKGKSYPEFTKELNKNQVN